MFVGDDVDEFSGLSVEILVRSDGAPNSTLTTDNSQELCYKRLLVPFRYKLAVSGVSALSLQQGGRVPLSGLDNPITQVKP